MRPAAPSRPMTSAQPDRPSVLVVEDEARIRELVALHLQLEGLAPVEATDGDADSRSRARASSI